MKMRFEAMSTAVRKIKEAGTMVFLIIILFMMSVGDRNERKHWKKNKVTE